MLIFAITSVPLGDAIHSTIQTPPLINPFSTSTERSSLARVMTLVRSVATA